MSELNIDNKEIFYKRKNMYEFLREHPRVKDLYNLTLQALGIQGLPEEEALNVFNQAYFLCTLVTENWVNRYTLRKQTFIPNPEKNKRQCMLMEMSIMVTYNLLMLHRKLLKFDVSLIVWLRRSVQSAPHTAPFRQFAMENFEDFEKPLNFSGKGVVPVEEKLMEEDPYKMLEAALKLTDAARKNYQTCQENQETRIKELQAQLIEESTKNKVLQLQLSKMTDIRTVAQKASDDDADINAAINYNTICDYICELSDRDDAEAKALLNMLYKLPVKNNVHNPKLFQRINQVEEYRKNKVSQPNVLHVNGTYIGKQTYNNNQNSQVFNGDVTDSQFGK